MFKKCSKIYFKCIILYALLFTFILISSCVLFYPLDFYHILVVIFYFLILGLPILLVLVTAYLIVNYFLLKFEIHEYKKILTINLLMSFLLLIIHYLVEYLKEENDFKILGIIGLAYLCILFLTIGYTNFFEKEFLFEREIIE